VSETKVIKFHAIRDLLAAVLSHAGRLVAPVADGDRHVIRDVDAADAVCLPPVSTANTAKEIFFPRRETLLTFRRDGCGVRITDGVAEVRPFVLFGIRPCDAAGLAVLDRVFNWDSVDPSWRAAREAATVVAVACSKSDDYCFCTSVGLSPASREGADVLFVPTADEEYVVEAVTPKGAAFVAEYAPFFRAVETVRPAVAEVPSRIDLAAARKWLEGNFQSPFWDAASRRCLGCGVCTYYCPTCHCFDIQDEADGAAGERVRGWDSCSFALFTRHAGGHNPRADRASRWRQRILHKFSYYPALFDVIACTGCGRCGRLCPVDLGVEETLKAISEGRS
jgi:ferredoxin